MYLRNWNVQLGDLNGYDKLMYIPNEDKKGYWLKSLNQPTKI